MVSKIKQFIALLLIALSSLVQANTIPGGSNLTNPTLPDEDVCNLGAPAFFNVMNVGTTWAEVAWAPVVGAFQYHIVTTEVSSGTLLNDMYVSAAYNGATITPLPPGTICRSEIWAVCQNGQDGTGSTVTPNYGTPIMDLVDCAIWGTSHLTPTDCVLGVGYSNGCQVTNNAEGTTALRVSDGATNPTNYRYFKVYMDGNVLKVAKNAITYGNIDFDFRNVGGGAIYVTIDDVDQELFTTMSLASGGRKLYLIEDASTVVIRKMDGRVVDCLPVRSPDDDQEWEPITFDNQHLSASPNPFTKFLEVQIPFATAKNDVKMSLYDLQGRLALSVKIPGGAQIHSLSTNDLLPGLYLLRVETGDRTETIKVVKTQ